jgi:hypothetical protein
MFTPLSLRQHFLQPRLQALHCRAGWVRSQWRQGFRLSAVALAWDVPASSDRAPNLPS